MPQAAHSVSVVLQEAQTHTETSKRSWDTICSPITPRKAKSTDGGGFPAPPDDFLSTATAASTGLYRAAATPAGGSRAPATARGLHGAALPPDFVPAPPAVVKRPPMPHPPNRHGASMFRTNT
ncbi:hypothetical protein H8959_011502 [Pygathrix nigripes]